MLRQAVESPHNNTSPTDLTDIALALEIFDAIKKGDLNEINGFLGQKFITPPQDTQIKTVEQNCADIIALLIEHGADINTQDLFGHTALMDATAKGYSTIVATLIKHGANVNAQDALGFTALMYAVKNKNAEIINVLITHNADVNIQDKTGQSALMLALESINAEVKNA